MPLSTDDLEERRRSRCRGAKARQSKRWLGVRGYGARRGKRRGKWRRGVTGGSASVLSLVGAARKRRGRGSSGVAGGN
ncbi:unnamed protein product [Linum trigynum]|uniref:Uncharacterized protein n=1 Tax=Linum trigynum TaxID=586398 RepID=A0AAV2FVW3_9ROSI